MKRLVLWDVEVDPALAKVISDLICKRPATLKAQIVLYRCSFVDDPETVLGILNDALYVRGNKDGRTIERPGQPPLPHLDFRDSPAIAGLISNNRSGDNVLGLLRKFPKKGAFLAKAQTRFFTINDSKLLYYRDDKREVSGKWPLHFLLSQRDKVRVVEGNAKQFTLECEGVLRKYEADSTAMANICVERLQ